MLLKSTLWSILFLSTLTLRSQNTNYGSNSGTGGSANTNFGSYTGASNHGTSNTFLGAWSGRYSVGNYNFFGGSNAGLNSGDGDYNVFLGSNAGKNAEGSSNVFIGYASGFKNDGNNNLFAGMDAGYNGTTGSNNVFLGFRSGYLSTGSNNVFLGYQAGYNETSSNKLYIDNTSTSSPLIWGDFSSNVLAVNGNMGIGTSNPSEKLDVNGRINTLGITGLDLANGGISGVNFDITGVNWLKIDDPGEGINFHDQGYIKIVDDATDDKFYIGPGNVGIGTETAAFKLDVSGDIRANGGDFISQGDDGLKNNTDGTYFFSDDANYWRSRSDRGITIANRANQMKGRIYHNNSNGFGLLDGDGNWGLRLERDSYTSFSINNSEKMRILTGGNVGIGLTSPSQKLDVSGNIRASGLLYATGGNSGDWNTAFGWGDHGNFGYLTDGDTPDFGDGMNLRGASPSIHFNDTNSTDEASITVNGDWFYIRGHDNTNSESHASGWDINDS